jgi:transcriptional repressor NrdR
MSKEGRVIRRRRACRECEHRFTTYERVEEFVPLVVKKDGTREPLNRHKIVRGMSKACEKRHVSAETIEGAVDELERYLQEEGGREISSAWIGEWVMRRLRDVDEVAYVRFASVYRSFRDINEFMDELKDLLQNRDRPDRTPQQALPLHGVLAPGEVPAVGATSPAPPRGSGAFTADPDTADPDTADPDTADPDTADPDTADSPGGRVEQVDGAGTAGEARPGTGDVQEPSG